LVTVPRQYFVGLDLGQARDFSALVVLSRVVGSEYQRSEHGPAKPPYELPYLTRFPLGTPYPDIVATVTTLLLTPELRGALLVVDDTGVGRAVSDMFRVALQRVEHPWFIPVTITSGRRITPSDGGYHVPKKILVRALQTVLQTQRLRIARALPEAELLMKELQNFRVRVTAAANETFGEWREGQHDDMVLATALAAWAGERALPDEVKPGVPRVIPDSRDIVRRY
jgi:hypothetical protein